MGIPGGRARFGTCVLDDERRSLSVGGEPRHLTPRAYELLVALVAARPRVLSREELRARLWPDTYVSNTSLAQLVSELRGALGESPREGRFIRTVFGVGYGFAAEVEEERPAAEAAAVSDCWLEWKGRELPLVVGSNVLGRAHDAQVRLRSGDVSRHHARIVVAGAGAVIEDLGSRNGTFVGGRRVVRPTPLADGDSLCLGRQPLVFCAAPALAATRSTTGAGADGREAPRRSRA